MKSLEFDWDQAKSRSNKKETRHLVRRGAVRFEDPNARLISDPDHSGSEERFILLGLNGYLRILVVCHCYREGDTIIRIISARKANRKETLIYEENTI